MVKTLFQAITEDKIKRFVQFCLVGSSGVGVNMGVFWFLVNLAGLSEPYDLIALLLSIEISTLSNFLLNDIWTFRDRRAGGIKAKLLRALKFNLVSIGYVIINYAVYTPLTRFTDIYYLLAWFIATGIGMIWNFSMSVLWTWRKSETGISSSP